MLIEEINIWWFYTGFISSSLFKIEIEELWSFKRLTSHCFLVNPPKSVFVTTIWRASLLTGSTFVRYYLVLWFFAINGKMYINQLKKGFWQVTKIHHVHKTRVVDDTWSIVYWTNHNMMIIWDICWYLSHSTNIWIFTLTRRDFTVSLVQSRQEAQANAERRKIQMESEATIWWIWGKTHIIFS